MLYSVVTHFIPEVDHPQAGYTLFKKQAKNAKHIIIFVSSGKLLNYFTIKIVKL
jgi:hypothetical protein